MNRARPLRLACRALPFTRHLKAGPPAAPARTGPSPLVHAYAGQGLTRYWLPGAPFRCPGGYRQSSMT
jgi:hypothetical protein